MFNKKLVGIGSLLVLTILISACTLGQTPAPAEDPNIISTQAMALVATQFSMQQTMTALAVPPTPQASPTQQSFPTFPVGGVTPAAGITPFGSTTPGGFLPTATLQALATASGPKCNDAIFIADITVPDDTVFNPGVDFQKIWRVQNTGTCVWDDGYVFKYLGGVMDGYDIKLNSVGKFVQPGATADFEVTLTAPLAANTYQECWSMLDDRGYYFGQSPLACVKIIVK